MAGGHSNNPSDETLLCVDHRQTNVCASDMSDLAPTVTSKWSKLSGGPAGSISELGNSVMVAQPIAFQSVDHGADASFDLSPTISRHDPMAVAQPITQYGDIAASLTARHDSSPCADRGANVVVQPIPLDLRNAGRDPEKHDAMNRQSVGIGESGEPAHTVTTACVHGVAQPIAMRESGLGYWMEDTVAGTLDANMGMSGHANRPAVIKQASMAVRCLTPVECERLQGFPDNYTNIPWRKADESPDGPRYKALGNSMAVPVMRWIGERIDAIKGAA